MDVVTKPDLADAEQNRTRRRIFEHCRGREPVFDGLDLDSLDWHWAELSEHDLRDATLTCRNHFEARYGTRRPGVIAKLWDARRPTLRNGVMERVRAGERFEPPLLVTGTEAKPLVILEGHNRIISILRAAADYEFPLRALVGKSPRIAAWCQW